MSIEPPYWQGPHTGGPISGALTRRITIGAPRMVRYRVIRTPSGQFHAQSLEPNMISWATLPNGIHEDAVQAEAFIRHHHESKFPQVVKTLELPIP